MDPAVGLAGDHYSNAKTRSRQVTLIGQEALSAIAAFLRVPGIEPGLLRRNVVIGGMNLHALRSRRIRLKRDRRRRNRSEP